MADFEAMAFADFERESTTFSGSAHARRYDRAALRRPEDGAVHN